MKKATPYILLAEDDQDDRELFIEALTEHHTHIPVKHVKDGKDLFKFLDSCPRDDLPSLILLDYNMPLLTAPEALRQLAASVEYAHITTIVWSSSQRSKDINECLRLGANLYLHIDHLRGKDPIVAKIYEWLIGGLVGVILSLPDALGTKQYKPILGLGLIGGLICGQTLFADQPFCRGPIVRRKINKRVFFCIP